MFRKGKTEALKFKNSGQKSTETLAFAKPETKDVRQKIKVKKILVGKGEHYYSKSKIGQFLIENKELSVGDKVLIIGPTTGEQELTISQLFVNGTSAENAKIGDQITFELPFRIRLSDKLYKIIED